MIFYFNNSNLKRILGATIATWHPSRYVQHLFDAFTTTFTFRMIIYNIPNEIFKVNTPTSRLYFDVQKERFLLRVNIVCSVEQNTDRVGT